MQLDLNSKEPLRQYLLGRLPEEEIVVLEERLFSDPAFYEELLIVEDELIDQYLSGEQSQSERESFDAHFCVAPERRQKVRFARALKKYVNNASEGQLEDVVASEGPGHQPIRLATDQRRPLSFLSQNPILSYSLAATIILALGAVSWMTLNRLRNPKTEGPGQVFAVVLTPGLTRSDGEIKKITIPTGTATLNLQLELPKVEFTSYRAELLTSERVSIVIKEGLKPDQTTSNKSISFPISTSLIKRDDYHVKLAGKRADGTYEDVTSYVFRLAN